VTTDGRVVSASEDQTLKIWDLDTGQELASLVGHTDRVTACVVTDDRLISASDDRTLKIWDLESGRELATLEGHTDRINACAVTADGRYVVSASDDRTLRVWDLDTYACLFTHRGTTAYFAVAATTTTIVAGDSTGDVWILDWPSTSTRSAHPAPSLTVGVEHGPAFAELEARLRTSKDPLDALCLELLLVLVRNARLTLEDALALAKEQHFSEGEALAAIERLAHPAAAALQRFFIDRSGAEPRVLPAQEVRAKLLALGSESRSRLAWTSAIEVAWAGSEDMAVGSAGVA